MKSLLEKNISSMMTYYLYYLIPTVYSIQCYQCIPKMTPNCHSFTSAECIKQQTNLACPQGMNYCMRMQLHVANKNVAVHMERRSCANKYTCSMLKRACNHHENFTDLKCNSLCCDYDLCNANSRSTAECVLLLVLAFCAVAFSNLFINYA